MSFTTFDVHGPYPVPWHHYYRKRHITERCPEFWTDETKRLHSKLGCYAFGIRAGRGIRLTYIGLTTRQTFSKECFTKHKVRAHYDRALKSVKRGTPVLLFLTARNARRTPKNRIAELETFLIQTCLAKGVKLTNIRKRGHIACGIAGVTPKAKGRPKAESALLRRATRL